VRVEYAAGDLRIGEGSASNLYRMDLSYDESRYAPVSDYDSGNRTAVLGLRPAGEGGVRAVSREQLSQEATVSLSPKTDLALDLSLGAADAEVELGGLRVTDLRVKTGASRTVIRFSQPNGVRCQSASFTAGAADVAVLGLGNSRCDGIAFEGGVGKLLLDFTGKWTSSSDVRVRMAMGELTLRLPRQAGIRLSMDKFLSSFDPVGLVRRGNAFESANYDPKQPHLDLDLTTAVGGVKVEWAE
jgi:hypothetical protein